MNEIKTDRYGNPERGIVSEPHSPHCPCGLCAGLDDYRDDYEAAQDLIHFTERTRALNAPYYAADGGRI